MYLTGWPLRPPRALMDLAHTCRAEMESFTKAPTGPDRVATVPRATSLPLTGAAAAAWPAAGAGWPGTGVAEAAWPGAGAGWPGAAALPGVAVAAAGWPGTAAAVRALGAAEAVAVAPPE